MHVVYVIIYYNNYKIEHLFDISLCFRDPAKGERAFVSYCTMQQRQMYVFLLLH